MPFFSYPETSFHRHTLKQVWQAHLQELTVASEWSEREMGPHINIMEIKVVLLALSAFQQYYLGF